MLVSDEQLLKFKNVQHGCLSPEGELISCGVYEHIDVMGVKDYYEEVYSEFWQEANAIVDEEAQQAADEGDEYYHPAWHRFDIADDSRQKAYNEAYKKGWIRLSVYQNNLYAESSQETLEKNTKALKFISDCLGFVLNMKAEKYI